MLRKAIKHYWQKRVRPIPKFVGGFVQSKVYKVHQKNLIYLKSDTLPQLNFNLKCVSAKGMILVPDQQIVFSKDFASWIQVKVKVWMLSSLEMTFQLFVILMFDETFEETSKIFEETSKIFEKTSNIFEDTSKCVSCATTTSLSCISAQMSLSHGTCVKNIKKHFCDLACEEQ